MNSRPAQAVKVALFVFIAGAAGACAQLVGADFDDLRAGAIGEALDGSTEAPDGTAGGASGDAGGDDGGITIVPRDAAATPDGGVAIDDDGGTVFIDAGCSGPTTITGSVYDPSGKMPLYDVLVYVPTTGLDPIPEHLWCDRCGAMPSGAPATIALSRPDGTFTLENAPAGTDIPIVVQTGKWRRVAHIPVVSACQPNALTDPNLTRLPKSSTTDDGTMPKIAVVTGAGDAIECVLLAMGIDSSEFASPGSGGAGGHVTLFAQNGGGYVTSATIADGGAQGPELYSSLSSLEQYDQVFFGCEGENIARDPNVAANVASFADHGGRVWLEHFEYTWLQAMPAAYASQITFLVDEPTVDTQMAIDTTFPKGSALSTWMGAVGAATSSAFAAADTRADVASTIARPWMTTTYGGVDDAGVAIDVITPEQISFNTPPPGSASAGPQCGRVIYSDYHSGALGLTGAVQFPAECDTSAPMTAEGRALEATILDLGACILSDTQTPAAP